MDIADIIVLAISYGSPLALILFGFFIGRYNERRHLADLDRREALLRVMEEAQSKGANAVWNVRYETSTVGRGFGNKGLAMAEVMAYGTALWITSEQ